MSYYPTQLADAPGSLTTLALLGHLNFCIIHKPQNIRVATTGGKWGQMPPPQPSTVAKIDPDICANPMSNMLGEIVDNKG